MKPITWFAVVLAICAKASARSPADAPALPAPKGRVLRVATVDDLYRTMVDLQSNTTVLLEKGAYQLTKPVHVPAGIDNVAIRGATGKFEDVILKGAGMNNQDVWHGITVERTNGLLVADLTIGWVGYHPIMIQPACRNICVYHCRLVDAGEQFVKASSNRKAGGVDGGRVEYSVVEYSKMGPPDGYTNGVDVHGGKDWVIRHNLFRNIRTPAGAKYRNVPAVLMWNGARNTICESNTFVNCDRAIAFGLVQRPGFLDHQGGVIRNNFVHVGKGDVIHVDAGIHVVSPGTKVLHNTIILNGGYPNAIEARFPATIGVEVRNNLCDAAIVARGNAIVKQSGNVINAREILFRDALRGDLHIVARSGLEELEVLSACRHDWDGAKRSPGKTMAGADETPVN